MAVQTDVSSPTSGTAAVYSLLTQLCTAGWLVKAWSDATTYTGGVSLSANPYSGSGSGAGNLGNTSAWFRVAAPDASREWLFQRGAADQTWTISRSKAGFVGGTPNATTAGTATDATALFSAASAFTATPGRLFVSADDADDYGWRLMCIPSGGGNVRTLIADVPLDSPDPADTDPYLWVGYYDATGLSIYAAGAAMQQIGTALVYKRFVGAGNNQRVTLASFSDVYGRVAPPESAAGGALPSNSREVPLPVAALRTGAPSTSTGWCGFARGIRWSTVQGRTNGQTLDGTTEYWIYAAGLWLRWDSSAPTLS